MVTPQDETLRANLMRSECPPQERDGRAGLRRRYPVLDGDMRSERFLIARSQVLPPQVAQLPLSPRQLRRRQRIGGAPGKREDAGHADRERGAGHPDEVDPGPLLEIPGDGAEERDVRACVRTSGGEQPVPFGVEALLRPRLDGQGDDERRAHAVRPARWAAAFAR